jgi:hypothetical protein
MLHY